ncbi:cytochrome P450 [Parathielavia appendiculata]|uniref:Cytochrome P450 n=1 Tax=Parathielavia appendiculata TaxID=2587402 RepID=A0AAN6TTD3_9PEZI|nr:cytochrome P450 [Parathielavia appendiculata]
MANLQMVYETVSAQLAVLSQATADLYLEGVKEAADLVHHQQFIVIVVPPKVLGEFQKLLEDVTIILHTIESNLTPALARLTPLIVEEVKASIRDALPPCNDWTPININHASLRIVAQVPGRIFIGAELSRSGEYLDAAVNYTVEVMEAVRALDTVHPCLRPQRLALADELLRPVVAAHRRMEGSEKPDDMLQWLMNGQDSLIFVAVHTTGVTLTNALPATFPELRDEIRPVLAEHKDVLNNSTLQAMKKVDNFLKETTRLQLFGFDAMQRQVNKTFTLSNGQVIPAGVVVQVSSATISRDADIFPNPDKLDPWRFFRLREEARARALMIVPSLFLNYDIRLPEGVQERYPNLSFGPTLHPIRRRPCAGITC